MDKIVQEVDKLKRLNEVILKSKREIEVIKAKEKELKDTYETLQLKMICAPDKMIAQYEYDNQKYNIELEKEKIRDTLNKLMHEFEKQKERTTFAIGQEIRECKDMDKAVDLTYFKTRVNSLRFGVRYDFSKDEFWEKYFGEINKGEKSNEERFREQYRVLNARNGIGERRAKGDIAIENEMDSNYNMEL